MKKSLCVVLLTLAIVLSSCSSSLPEDIALIATASFGVPYMFDNDLKGRKIDVLETDAYGRILFSMFDYSFFVGQEVTTLVIMQKQDDQYVYFYEDYCYAMEDFSEETKLVLKKKNDWNLPLNESKMSQRTVEVTFDLNIKRDTVIKIRTLKYHWKKDLAISEDQILSYAITDLDQCGKNLYWLLIENDMGIEENYFTIFDVSLKKMYYFKVEDATAYMEGLRSFKQSCGWNYGW